MITVPLAELLVKQIGSELSAHQNYMAISLYFTRKALHGWAKLFRNQAMEEAQHAMKIVNFLIDNQVEFDLPAILPASTQFPTPLDAVKSALASEQKVSHEFRIMAKVASDHDDYTGFQFLQWFLEEQVEEEAKMGDLIDLVESGINLFQAEALLAKFEEDEDED